jgi:septal ring factor EnvC (AmiA/AmiB activator)
MRSSKTSIRSWANPDLKSKEKLTMALAEKEQTLNDKEAELKKLADALKEREKRVHDLEALMSKKDAALADLKKEIADDALHTTSPAMNSR